MGIKELIQIALDALFANLFRTFLTALGIIIGTGSVISMMAIGNGAKSTVENRVSSLGANTITISPGSSSSGLISAGAGSSQTLVINDYDDIKSSYESDSQITGISPEQSQNTQLIYKDNNTNVSVYAVSPAYMDIKSYTLKAGTFFNTLQNEIAARVIVLGSNTAETLFENTDPIGKEIKLGNQVFTVIGILNSKGSSGFMSRDDIGMIPVSTGSKVLQYGDSLRSIVVQVKDSNNISNVQNQLNTKLLELHAVSENNKDFSISNSQDTLETLSSISNTFTILLTGIAGISLLVGGIGIMNTMIISIKERTREIGLRKAIGAKDNVILFQFLIESVVLSGIGALFGILLGISIALILAYFNVIQTSISIGSIILSASISMIIGLIFGVYPARQAAKLDPIDALKYE